MAEIEILPIAETATQDYQRIQESVEEVGRMLNGLIASMRPESGY